MPAHQDGIKTHPASGFQVAGSIVEDDTALGTILPGDKQRLLIRCGFRLAVPVHASDVDNSIEAILYPQGGKDPPGVGGIGIGEDPFTLGQAL